MLNDNDLLNIQLRNKDHRDVELLLATIRELRDEVRKSYNEGFEKGTEQASNDRYDKGYEDGYGAGKADALDDC